MTKQPKPLQLADLLDTDGWPDAATELRRLHALVSACEPFLKEDETPAQRIERERRDTEAMCRLYARERALNAELLEALQSLIDMDVAYKRGPKVEDAVEAARAAISKATGEKA